MQQPIVSISTIAYQGYDLPIAVEEIADVGAKYVEFAFITGYSEGLSSDTFSMRQAQTIKGLLVANGLQTVALAAHMDLGLQEAVSDFKARMDFAKEIGARIILTNSSTQNNRSTFFDNIEKLALHAESIGITIAFENPGDGEQNLIGAGKDGAKIIEAINSTRVRLNYDFCNTYSYSKGKIRPEDDLKHAMPFAVHYHLKDMRPDNRGWYFSEIGNQLIDYDQLLPFLFQQTEQLPIGLELPLKVRRDRSFNPQKESKTFQIEDIRAIVKQSFKYVMSHLEDSEN
jgi:sugar phosphate isomerase/epimerase